MYANVERMAKGSTSFWKTEETDSMKLSDNRDGSIAWPETFSLTLVPDLLILVGFCILTLPYNRVLYVK